MAATSVHMRILVQIRTDIRALNLSWVTPDQIVIVPVPEAAPIYVDDKHPALSISPVGREVFGDGTNESDDIGYPVTLAIHDAAHGNDAQESVDAWLDTRLVWREELIDKYSHARISGITGTANAFDTVIEPGPVFDVFAWHQKARAVSVVNLRCQVRKMRRV